MKRANLQMTTPMRHELFGFRGVGLFALAVTLASACTSTGPGGSGAGGKGGASPSCTEVTPCGGSVVGTWMVSSSCLVLAGDLDGAYLSLGCSTIPVTGTVTTSGTFTANADGTYTDNTTTKGSANFSPGDDCLSVSSVRVTCEKAADAFRPLGWQTTCSLTGGKCNCSAVFDLPGGIGYSRDQISLNGAYVTSGNTLRRRPLCC